MFKPDFNTPLADVVDAAILAAPTDCRRYLYNNIVLAGGSTMFKVRAQRGGGGGGGVLLCVAQFGGRCLARSTTNAGTVVQRPSLRRIGSGRVVVEFVVDPLSLSRRPLAQAFGKRLERDIKKRVTARYNRNLELYNITREEDKPKKLDVRARAVGSVGAGAEWWGGGLHFG